jgi:TPR repeat protein
VTRSNLGGLIALALLLMAAPDAGACLRDPKARPQAQVQAKPPSPEARKLYEEGQAAEERKDMRAALTLYERAAKAGSGAAAKRLGEIYDKGVGGVPREYSQANRWYNAARALGEPIPLAGC